MRSAGTSRLSGLHHWRVRRSSAVVAHWLSRLCSLYCALSPSYCQHWHYSLSSLLSAVDWREYSQSGSLCWSSPYIHGSYLADVSKIAHPCLRSNRVHSAPVSTSDVFDSTFETGAMLLMWQVVVHLSTACLMRVPTACERPSCSWPNCSSSMFSHCY